jgi:flagellar hook-length control protein FliK
MNSSSMSATASPGSAPATDASSLLSPAATASADAGAGGVTTAFQALIQQLLPDAEHTDLAADSTCESSSASTTPDQSADQDLSTAGLLLQLPSLGSAAVHANTATPADDTSDDPVPIPSQAATPVPMLPVAAFAVLQAEPASAGDEPAQDRSTARINVATDRPGENAGIRLADSALQAVVLKSQEPAERSATSQGHQGEKGAQSPTPQSVPQLAAAVADAALTRDPQTLPRLENPVGTAAWRQELSNTVNLMIDRGEQTATLRLSPDHLGPLEVRIAVREGETSLWFGAAHAETRHALEQALPRLREQFASAGLSLGHSWVSQGSPQEPRTLRAAMISGIGGEGSDSRESSVPAAQFTSRITGLIDTYV